jgi:hypothetical protein
VNFLLVNIGGYFKFNYHKLVVIIILMTIGGFWWLLLVILLMAIGGYSIGDYSIGDYFWLYYDYWWLFYYKLLLDILHYIIICYY